MSIFRQYPLRRWRNSNSPSCTASGRPGCGPGRRASTWCGGLLGEFGLVLPTEALRLVPGVMGLIEDADVEIPMTVRVMFSEVCTEIRELEARIQSVERELEALARQMPEVARLRSIPGIGLLTSTAMVGFVGDPRRFRSCRHFASYLGLTPRERSSGNRRRLGAISKQGNVYLRMLLIHGGRTLL